MALSLSYVLLPMHIQVVSINVFFCYKIKEHKIINLEQVNFLIFWAATAVVFYAVGKVIGKIIGIRTLHHFGLIIILIVILLEIGVAHGFNMFIFL